jgi:hypothetical protein
MKNFAILKEVVKNEKNNNNKLRKDESYQQYRDFKHEINTIVRNINIKFNFQDFTKENLQPLEVVSSNFLYF